MGLYEGIASSVLNLRFFFRKKRIGKILWNRGINPLAKNVMIHHIMLLPDETTHYIIFQCNEQSTQQLLLGNCKLRIHQGPDSTHREIKSFFLHICETNTKPTWFSAVARGSRGDIQPEPANHFLPQIHFRFKRHRIQQEPHIHPAEQSSVALQAMYPCFLQPRNQHSLSISQSSPILLYILVYKPLVS